MKKTLLQAENLQHHYGANCAVKDMSLSLKQGDILGLLGPNGAGKSTTMKMLCGVLPPHSGQITLNGFDLFEQATQAKQQIGYLPEQPPLYPELSVNEYLIYSAQLRRIKKTEINKAREKAIQRCGLSSVQDKLISQLSKGFQQRVGIAQAIIHNPPIVILDEPTVGLDPIQIREIRQLISELGEQHAVILSTHILPEVQAVCNQVKIIHQGELVYSDNMQALESTPQPQLLKVRFQQAVSCEEIKSLDCIQSCDAQGEQQFLLRCDDSQIAAQAIVKIAVEKNWGLLELTPQQQSLESIFVHLTASDKNTGEALTQ